MISRRRGEKVEIEQRQERIKSDGHDEDLGRFPTPLPIADALKRTPGVFPKIAPEICCLYKEVMTAIIHVGALASQFSTILLH
jgi:hypothetical protein